MKDYKSYDDCIDYLEIMEYRFKSKKGVLENIHLFANRVFLMEWIEINSGVFYEDEGRKNLIELFEITAKYIQNKADSSRTIQSYNFQKFYKQNNLKRHQDSVKTNLKKVKKDLELLRVKGQKTDSLLELIDEALNRIELFIPNIRVVNCNVEEIRRFLTNLGVIKSSIDEYIKEFQEYNFEFKKEELTEIKD